MSARTDAVAARHAIAARGQRTLNLACDNLIRGDVITNISRHLVVESVTPERICGQDRVRVVYRYVADDGRVEQSTWTPVADAFVIVRLDVDATDAETLLTATVGMPL